jgi:hypothetical protein
MRYPETAGGGSAAPAESKPADKPAPESAPNKEVWTGDEWRAYCESNKFSVTDLSTRTCGAIGMKLTVLTDAQARIMLSTAAAFLYQLVKLVSGVVETVDVGHLRDIVGPELSLPAHIVRKDDTVSLKETPPAEQPPDRDGRKNPRGRKHPLVALIELAAKAAKLLDKITRGLNPNAHDIETLESRVQARADALDQRREAANNKLFTIR